MARRPAPRWFAACWPAKMGLAAELCWRTPRPPCLRPIASSRSRKGCEKPPGRSIRTLRSACWKGCLVPTNDSNRGELLMAQKVILVADPGIDTAFAVALALHDPEIDVVGLVASAGNIPADRATQNVHLLINAVDPPKWPRLGAALPVTYDIDGTKLHGPDGL